MQKIELKDQDLKNNQRVRWSIETGKIGPVVVLFVGIHGNEPAGTKAVDQIADKLQADRREAVGAVYAISGNIQALDLGVRYIDTDLNRLWEIFQNIRSEPSQDSRHNQNGRAKTVEYVESLEIKETLEKILKKHKKSATDFVFADLHTTSSQSCAFILLNDTLSNREIARKFPVPQILGIEENIHGTLLSYINNLGYKAIGFEAGAHEDDLSVERSKSFLWLLLHNSGVLILNESEKEIYEESIQAHDGVPDTYYEVRYHKRVDDPGKFQMITGFQNFDPIDKGTPLAYEFGKLIKAPEGGRIFMPLYQKVGHDGFLIVRAVSPVWLELSSYLRKSSIHNYLKYLPGVTVNNERSYIVDLQIARFLVKDIFHLFGYRVSKIDEVTLICHKR